MTGLELECGLCRRCLLFEFPGAYCDWLARVIRKFTRKVQPPQTGAVPLLWQITAGSESDPFRVSNGSDVTTSPCEPRVNREGKQAIVARVETH